MSGASPMHHSWLMSDASRSALAAGRASHHLPAALPAGPLRTLAPGPRRLLCFKSPFLKRELYKANGHRTHLGDHVSALEDVRRVARAVLQRALPVPPVQLRLVRMRRPASNEGVLSSSLPRFSLIWRVAIYSSRARCRMTVRPRRHTGTRAVGSGSSRACGSSTACRTRRAAAAWSPARCSRSRGAPSPASPPCRTCCSHNCIENAML